MIPTYFLCIALLCSAIHGAPEGELDCSADKHECSCPDGTTYFECTTSAVIGATTEDVTALTGDFFHTEWMGLAPESTDGEDNVRGSTRTLMVPTQVGTYQFTEELLFRETKGDGSYKLKFKQQNGEREIRVATMQNNPTTAVPVKYDSAHAPGSFAGFCVTRSAEYAAGYRTKVEWNVYACLTGMVGFPEFHRYALNNATAVLQMQGKIRGISEPPHSDCTSNGSAGKMGGTVADVASQLGRNRGLRIQ